MSEYNSRGYNRRGSHRGRPPGLRGRDIGLYYARRQLERRRHDDARRSAVKLDEDQKQSIRRLFGSFQRGDLKPRGHHQRFAADYRRHLDANAGRASQTESDVNVEPAVDEELDTRLTEKLELMNSSPDFVKMLNFRKKLPAFDLKNDLVKLIRSNPVSVISGETGCGKTTQVPQFILDDAIERGEGSRTRIICTQPRRISAISVAERVADERAEPCGGHDSSVGYQIRLESRLPREMGSILYCTTGVVLQWMRSNPTLTGISHIVLDEIHERDILSDFLITLLRDLLSGLRKDLKVVLMSATLNARQFSRYFGNCPTINIPGFTFPVKEYYLEDVLEVTNFKFTPKHSNPGPQRPHWHKFTKRGKEENRRSSDYADFIEPYLRNISGSGQYSKATIDSLSSPESEEINLDLIALLVRHIHHSNDEGAVLVFLPGWDDISKLFKLLTEDAKLRLDPSSVRIYPLHSLLPSIDQKAIFNKPPPGVRKIVIATNIAETSITIEDVVYVVDCGKIKMTNFDVNSNLSTLKPEWVSLANARQRRGRAGRVRPGICYHLFTRAREMILDQFVLPEILRTRLEEVILQIKSLGLGLAKPFLSKVMDPPNEKAVDLALEMLKDIGALFIEEESLTPLGFHLSRLPMDPQTGKMILFGAIFSCLDPVLTIASSLSFKDPFVIPLGKESLADSRRCQLAGNSKSDHLMLANAFKDWEWASRDGFSRQFCWENFLSESTLKMLQNMKNQFAEHLYDMKFIDSKNVKAHSANRNSRNEALVRAIVCAGLYPNVAKIRIRRNKHRGEFVSLQTARERKSTIHPKSVNAKVTEYKYPWMVFHQIMKSSSVYVHDCSMVSPLALIFFGKQVSWGHADADIGGEVIHVDDFVQFNCADGTAELIQDLRRALDIYLDHKVLHPNATDWDSEGGSKEGDLLKAIIELLSCELEDMEPEFDDEED